MSGLTEKRCVPCEGGVPPLNTRDVEAMLGQLEGWARNGKSISKEFNFSNFAEAMVFVNRAAALAEEEGHHPDIHIHYSIVRFDIWTHAIGGLSENDFILAAKIDDLKSA